MPLKVGDWRMLKSCKLKPEQEYKKVCIKNKIQQFGAHPCSILDAGKAGCYVWFTVKNGQIRLLYPGYSENPLEVRRFLSLAFQYAGGHFSDEGPEQAIPVPAYTRIWPTWTSTTTCASCVIAWQTNANTSNSTESNSTD